MPLRILLCSDGSPTAASGEALVRALGIQAHGTLDVLGVMEPGHEAAPVEATVRAMADGFRREGVAGDLLIRTGHAAEEILAQAAAKSYDLVVVSSHGRRGLTRLRLGSTASRLARDLPTSLLVSRGVLQHVDRVLICTGGEATALPMLDMGGAVAAAASAGVTLLHVMSQVALSWDSPADDLADTAQSAMARNSREGAHLREGLDRLDRAGLRPKAVPRLRHGLVVDEVLAEIRESDQHLLVIGAHQPPAAASTYSSLLDDLAEQLLTHAPCSVLIVRAKRGD